MTDNTVTNIVFLNRAGEVLKITDGDGNEVELVNDSSISFENIKTISTPSLTFLNLDNGPVQKCRKLPDGKIVCS